MSEAAVLDVATLDASASAVEAEIPAIETPAEEPAQETSVEAGAEAKTENGKPAEKPASDGKDVTASSAALTPKAIVEKLSEIKKTDPALASRLHSEVKNSLDAKRFLKEVGAKDFAEAKTVLSKPDETTENFRQSVEATDAMLYAGGEQHAALVDNILADLTSELGEKEGPARLSELSENILEKLKTADPDGHTRITRSAFLAASETSGLINSLNKLNAYIVAGDTKSAANLLKSIGQFFSEEIAANENVAKTRAEAKAAAEKETTATVAKLRAESEVSVNKTVTTVLGGFLSPFLKNQLKGVSRADLETLASTIMSETKLTLGKDEAYVKEVSKLYTAMKTPAQKDRLMARFEQALKKDDFGKKLVERVCREKFPEKFAAKPVAAAKPTTVKTTINGKAADAYVFKTRPANLLHQDIVWKGQELTARDLSTLQATRQQGFVFAKDGKTPILCTWKAQA